MGRFVWLTRKTACSELVDCAGAGRDVSPGEGRVYGSPRSFVTFQGLSP